jgi:2'-5' RNA ligase
MPEERWRCFVAVPIGEELRASLTSYVEQLRRAPLADAWRWTDPASWHITLAFLGDIAPSSVPVVADALREVAARHTVFTVPTGGLGVFPSSQRPRVLWYGLEDLEGRLAALAADVRSALQVDEDRPFHSHITLARGRESVISPVTQLAHLYGDVDGLSIDRICLYRTGRGSYRRLREARFVGR